MAAVAGCSGPTGGGTSTADQQFVSGDGTVTTWSAGRPSPAAPAVRATTLEGGTVDLASYRGKVVVLNFWASWCAPCREEGPALQGLAADLKPEGVEFVGIDGADDADAARAFLTDIGSSYPNVDDSSGDAGAGVPQADPAGFPQHPGDRPPGPGRRAGERTDHTAASQSAAGAPGRARP